MNTKTTQKKQREVAEFNGTNPIGTQVNVRLDDGTIKETRTTSEAWLLGGHTPVVKLEGISGGYLLDRVRRKL